MKIAVGADHVGIETKAEVVRVVEALGHHVVDFGASSEDPVDYPDFASKVAGAVNDGDADSGVLICGTGLGMAIAATKIRGIRAVTANTPYLARMARQHNDANILCIGARVLSAREVEPILSTWLTTAFEGGPHVPRLEKIRLLE